MEFLYNSTNGCGFVVVLIGGKFPGVSFNSEISCSLQSSIKKICFPKTLASSVNISENISAVVYGFPLTAYLEGFYVFNAPIFGRFFSYKKVTSSDTIKNSYKHTVLEMLGTCCCARYDLQNSSCSLRSLFTTKISELETHK